MRVSTNQYSHMMSGSMSQNSLGINKIMQQMATGKRLLVPSDDPMAFTRAMNLKREQAAISQYMGNIEQADVALKKQETYLSSAVDVLQDVREKILWAGNGTHGVEERGAIAGELEHLQDSLVSLVNTKDENGKYIFSGNEVETQPLVKDAGGNWVYQGDTGVREVVVGDGVTIQLNVNAQDMFFSGGTDIFNQLDELVGALRDPSYDFESSDIISTSIDMLDDTLSSVLSTVTNLGSRQNALTTMQDGHSEVELFNNDLIGQLEDLDYADAMVQYNNYLLALQATQSTYAKTASLSLFSIM